MKPIKGIYLVIDPSQPWELLFYKVYRALLGGIQIIQIWNHWLPGIDIQAKYLFIQEILLRARPFEVPVLMHEDWELVIEAGLHGVHFDKVPENFKSIQDILKDRYIGLTVSNQLELIIWAQEQSLSYLSFCAVFPSPSVTTCEIVDPANIQKAREITQLPLFLSGGIRPGNLHRLRGLSFDGIAVISGILNAPDPEQAVRDYWNQLGELEMSF